MVISLTRGDTRLVTFAIKTHNNINYVLQPNDRLYLTVKKSFYDKDAVLQKTYGNGIKLNPENREYEIEFSSDETNRLSCNYYVFDIKLIVGDIVSETLIKGQISVDVNATHKENE